MIATRPGIENLIDNFGNLQTLASAPCLYFDLEGVKLGRSGTISIMQVLVHPADRTHLIDIHTLGEEAFNIPGQAGLTLKDILQSETIPKVFFDVRNDSDALFAHFGIKLAGIQDLQLMELGARTNRPRKYVSGLANCIEKDLGLTAAEKQLWKETKEKGLNLFAPERGGSYEVFNTRPLTDAVTQYCIQDVRFLPILWRRYQNNMNGHWRGKVREESKARVALSQTESYNGQGVHMKLAPDSF